MKVGIVVISFNHYLFTKFCIDSIVKNTSRDLYELCLVDNGSVDETKTWADQLLMDGTLDNFISNDYNMGACKASNQGVSLFIPNNGITHIVVMANDHIVTNNWLVNMLKAPFDCVNPFVFHSVKEIRGLYPAIGKLVDKYKPLRLRYLQEDNYENMLYVLSETYGDMEQFAQKFISLHEDFPYRETTFISWPGLIMYAKNIIESVGLKDEEYLKFDLASYADIDYYVRVYKAGFTTGVVMSSYVHHWGSITTRKLGLRQENITGYKNNERGAYNHFIKKWKCSPHDLSKIVEKRRDNG